MDNNYIIQILSVWHKYQNLHSSNPLRFQTNKHENEKQTSAQTKNETESNINNFVVSIEHTLKKSTREKEMKRKKFFCEILFLFVNNYRVMLLFIFSALRWAIASLSCNCICVHTPFQFRLRKWNEKNTYNGTKHYFIGRVKFCFVLSAKNNSEYKRESKRGKKHRPIT